MEASVFLKSAVEMYREEVSGGGKLVKVPELGLEFHVFPAQPEERLYQFSDLSKIQIDVGYAIKLLLSRAKKADGTSVFDSHAERSKAETMLMTRCPQAFDDKAATRVVDAIRAAYPTVSIEEAGNDSEGKEVISSNSISPLQNAVDVALTN